MILFSVSVNKYGSGKAVSRMLGMGILTAELGDDVVEVLFVQGPLRSRTSTMAAISHILETVVVDHERFNPCSSPRIHRTIPEAT
jgi:hypothetical protein